MQALTQSKDFTIKIFLNCRNSRIIGSSDNPPAPATTGHYLVKSRPSNVTIVVYATNPNEKRHKKRGEKKEIESSVWATLSHTNDPLLFSHSHSQSHRQSWLISLANRGVARLCLAACTNVLFVCAHYTAK